MLGNKTNLATLDGLDSRFRERLGIDIPLIGQPRLDDGSRAISLGNLEGMRLNELNET